MAIIQNDIWYCRRCDIDTIKWDKCVNESDCGLIYAQSFYLDLMAGKWDALVLNDYEAVMPLTWNRKYGFYYLYQPYFIHSLGIFGLKHIGVNTSDFLMALPKRLRYWDIKLNELNFLAESTVNFKVTIITGNNYLLNLNQPYKIINGGYKRLCRRMIKKATDSAVEIVKQVKPAEVISFYRKHYEYKHEGISAKVYDNLIACANICFEKTLAKTYLAKLPDGEVVAAYLVLVDKKFVYSLIGGSSERGKQTGSFYLLTDAAIKDHADTKRIFRFEGSDIEGIASFNAQFGVKLVNYLHLIRNKLPFPVNLLKRQGNN